MLYWQNVKGFGEVIQNAGKVGCLLCFDWGERHCGVAVSDRNFSVAMPIGVISPHSLMEKISFCNREYGVVGVIIGLPVKKDFSGIHEHGKHIIELCKKINDQIGLPVLLWDERMSTVGAFNIQHDQSAMNKRVANNSRVRLKGRFGIANKATCVRKDDLAAQFILDGLLDALKPFASSTA